MKPNPFLCLVIGFSVAYIAPLSSQNWTAAERFSSPNNSYLTSTATALAADGSIYLVGNFQNTARFDTIVLTAPIPNQNFGFLVKLDAQLKPLWAKSFPQNIYDLTVDAQENVLIAGSHWKLVNPNDSLAYLAKYNSNGVLLSSFSAEGNAESWAKVVRTDASGNCYVAGERFSSGTATFGPYSFPPTNSRECFLLKLTPDLSQVLWAKYTGNSPDLDNVYDLELDEANGFVYASGNYAQKCFLFDCVANIYNGDFYVEKHSTATGNSIWKKIFEGGSGTNTKQFARLSPDGQSLVVAADFKLTTQFSPILSLTANTNDDYHLYVAQISTSDASVQWAQKIATSGDSYLWRMSRKNDEIWLFGHFRKQTTIGAFVLNPTSYDGFLAKISANGTVIEAEKLSGNSNEYGYGLAQRDTTVVVSGASASTTLGIGTFNLPGNSNTCYIARKGGLPQLPPIAGFTASMAMGCAPLTVQFSNTSYQSPTTFYWLFPGGFPAISTAQNPSVIYNVPGMYTVTLLVTNGGGADTLVQANYITVSANNPSAAFSSMVNGLSVNFTNNSANASAYLWEFGDGQSSSEQNPIHDYTDCGTYTVILTSTNACNSAASTSSITVGMPNPSAAFSSMVNGLSVNFTNNSANASAYLWEFGDGQSSSEQNPIHDYSACGIYTVVLTSTNLCGTSSSTASVTTSATPTALFSATVDSLQVSLMNMSTGGTSYFWDFGDGNTSTLQDPPPHHYEVFGMYLITLVVTNNCGATIFQDNVSLLQVGANTPAKFKYFRVFPNPNTGIFWLEMSADWSDKVDFSILNARGQTVFTTTTYPHGTSISQSFDLENSAPGVYWLCIKTGAISWIHKVVVTR